MDRTIKKGWMVIAGAIILGVAVFNINLAAVKCVHYC